MKFFNGIGCLGILIVLGLSFLAMSGIVWLACWCLKAIGIFMIGSWVVAFSWPLVLVVWIVIWGLNSIVGHSK